MGTELMHREAGAAAAVTATRSSNLISKLACSLPEWLNLPALDASDLYGYGHPLPDGAAPALIAAAHEHRIALAPAAQEDIEKCLRGLRSATLIRDEDAQEARASLALLRAHLADVPIDILQDACRAYCNAPGRRYFPRSAGELRTFINPLKHARVARAVRLERLAQQAHEEQAERDRLAADPCTPEDCAAILAEIGLSSLAGPGREPRAATSRPSHQISAPIEDYLALGLSHAEAEQAMADRDRMLRRVPARPVGDLFEPSITAAMSAKAARA